MPDTADHRADMHRLATERRAAGLPVWDRKISVADVWRNEGMTFEQRRDAIVARFRASTWLKDADEFDDITCAVDELSEAPDVDAFDEAWEMIYDIADEERVWIATR